MAIDSNVVIQGGDYGILVTEKKQAPTFNSYGRASYLDEVYENIETGKFYLILSCTYKGKTRRATIQKGALTDLSVIRELADKGFQVYRRSYDAFVDWVNIQDEKLEERGIAPTRVFKHLGWIELPNASGGFDLCYRCCKLLGSQNGKYIGPYAIAPMGKFDEWKQMVENEVVGHDVLELVLIASLSAVTNGLIAPETNGENPIVHLNYASGKGKSTALALGASTSGEPFDGTITKTDQYGEPKEYLSIYQSWGATDNAMIASQAGNRGVVTILNELGKNPSQNLTRLIFDLSEGSDKRRLTTNLATRISQRYTTVFISSGESSLLEKCTAKLEGLNVRVMEITKPITSSAQHSNRIKEVCRRNNGFASPMLAKHIIKKGGVNYVLPIYKKWQKTLSQAMSDTPNKERFVEKFAALFMATAEIASEALEIAFDMEGLQNFLLDYDKENGNERNVALKAYEKVIEECRVNINNFHTSENPLNQPYGKIYGKICRPKNKTYEGKTVDEEFLIRGSFLESVLKKYGFPNKITCLRAWSEASLLSKDFDRYTRSRQIAPNSAKEDVYVLLTFKDEDTPPEKIKLMKSPLDKEDAHKRIKNLLADDEDEGGVENDDSVANS